MYFLPPHRQPLHLHPKETTKLLSYLAEGKTSIVLRGRLYSLLGCQTFDSEEEFEGYMLSRRGLKYCPHGKLVKKGDACICPSLAYKVVDYQVEHWQDYAKSEKRIEKKHKSIDMQ